jgi:hypothetical protein
MVTALLLACVPQHVEPVSIEPLPAHVVRSTRAPRPRVRNIASRKRLFTVHIPEGSAFEGATILRTDDGAVIVDHHDPLIALSVHSDVDMPDLAKLRAPGTISVEPTVAFGVPASIAFGRREGAATPMVFEVLSFTVGDHYFAVCAAADANRPELVELAADVAAATTF